MLHFLAILLLACSENRSAWLRWHRFSAAILTSVHLTQALLQMRVCADLTKRAVVNSRSLKWCMLQAESVFVHHPHCAQA